jgi:hypothetical protein
MQHQQPVDRLRGQRPGGLVGRPGPHQTLSFLHPLHLLCCYIVTVTGK